jgi:hypothetical protein
MRARSGPAIAVRVWSWLGRALGMALRVSECYRLLHWRDKVKLHVTRRMVFVAVLLVISPSLAGYLMR